MQNPPTMKEETLCLHYKTYDYDELPALDRQLIDSAKAACASAYAPYSKFQVGAAAWLDNGEIICGVSSGDGPIDSAFRAIEQCIGHHYELDDFQVQSVTEGKEALGSALVRLRNNGKLYSGNGTSTDIVAASIRAYINALNKIVFEEA